MDANHAIKLKRLNEELATDVYQNNFKNKGYK